MVGVLIVYQHWFKACEQTDFHFSCGLRPIRRVDVDLFLFLLS
jgi:hypothetical protein